MRRLRSKHTKSFVDRFPGSAPILTGAMLRERLIGCLGALIGISLTGFLCNLAIGGDLQLPLIVAPMGASAVLLFAVPASPLAQPWPIGGGNTISALVGVAVAQMVSDPLLAVGLAASRMEKSHRPIQSAWSRFSKASKPEPRYSIPP